MEEGDVMQKRLERCWGMRCFRDGLAYTAGRFGSGGVYTLLRFVLYPVYYTRHDLYNIREYL